jgi:glycosyltransferase involved in cell wall biosynthesis
VRIGIDVRYLSHGLVGGVHRYVRNLVPELMRQGGQHTFLLYADTKRPFELTDLPSNSQVRYLPYRNGLSSFYNDLFMRRAMAVDRLDIAHFPANYGFGPSNARTVITLHDEINILPLREIIRGHQKTPKTMAMMTYVHFITLAALRGADYVLTVSDYSREKIIQNSQFNPESIIAVHSGVPPHLKRVTDKAELDDVRARHALQKPFVLGDALKNGGLTVKAWTLLPESLRQNTQMVFFCRTPETPEPLRDAVAAGYAKVLIRPSNEDVMALYSMAEAFIFPSWIEGFGLPVLEAMTCGAPVIASNRGSIPEVAGDAALLVDAEDAAGLAHSIERVLTDPAEADRLRQLGFARAAGFSWASTARRVLDVYQCAAQRAQ